MYEVDISLTSVSEPRTEYRDREVPARASGKCRSLLYKGPFTFRATHKMFLGLPNMGWVELELHRPKLRSHGASRCSAVCTLATTTVPCTTVTNPLHMGTRADHLNSHRIARTIARDPSRRARSAHTLGSGRDNLCESTADHGHGIRACRAVTS